MGTQGRSTTLQQTSSLQEQEAATPCPVQTCCPLLCCQGKHTKSAYMPSNCTIWKIVSMQLLFKHS